MSNERRGTGMSILLWAVVAIWATTALLSIAMHTVHVLLSAAVSIAITAALVVLVLKAVAGSGSSKEEEH
jgi:hypothetical protein